MRLAVLVSGLLSCAVVLQAAWAQEAGFTPRKDTAQIPSYELVSIHKSKEGESCAYHDDQDGFTAICESLRSLIAEAYGFSLGAVNEEQLVGAPEWAKTEQFDIHAKVDAEDVAKLKELTKAETMSVEVRQIASRTPTFQMVMLQRMLTDRFQLKVHYEQRVMPLYEMTVAKGGVKMKPAHRPIPSMAPWD